jgi:hypothetical protein
MWEQNTIHVVCNYLFLLVLFSYITEAIVELLVAASPLEGFRAFVARKGKIGPFDLALFVTCGYCVSVWVSIAFAFIQPNIISFICCNDTTIFIDKYFWWFLNWMIIHRMSNLIHNKVMNKPIKLANWQEEDPK